MTSRNIFFCSFAKRENCGEEKESFAKHHTTKILPSFSEHEEQLAYHLFFITQLLCSFPNSPTTTTINPAHFHDSTTSPHPTMSFADIMSQQLVEELSKQEYEFEQNSFPEDNIAPSDPEPSDPEVPSSAVSEDNMDDEQLAREMQEAYDAEFAAALASGNAPKEEVPSKVLNASEEDEEELGEYVEFDEMGMPLFHSNRDANGELITKHNPVLSGMRNANKVQLYIEGAGDMDGTLIGNSVYNSLQQKSLQNEKKHKSSTRRTVF